MIGGAGVADVLVTAAAPGGTLALQGPSQAHGVVLVLGDDICAATTEQGVDGGVAASGKALHEVTVSVGVHHSG